MPVLGWLLGISFVSHFKAFDHWIAFFLLAFVGVRMIREGMDTSFSIQKKDPSRGMTMKQARRGYKQARDNMDSTLDDISDRGSAMMDAAQDAYGSVEETLEDAITQRPLATVGVALGIGFLIGFAWRR